MKKPSDPPQVDPRPDVKGGPGPKTIHGQVPHRKDGRDGYTGEHGATLPRPENPEGDAEVDQDEESRR